VVQPPHKLSPSDISRYSRHILLPEVGKAGQEKLKAARVLVIGAGGLGSPVSLYLAAAGVGTLGIVEFDTVDRSNLQRQILYADADVGRPKLEAAAARLQALAPDLKIERFAASLEAANAAGIIRGFDLVVDGTDNFATRYLVNDACVLLGKPNVYGSIFRFDGQASVFDARRGPCYRCLFPAPPPPDQVPNCAEGGVLGVLPGLIGMVQATEALKLILGKGDALLGRLLVLDAMAMRFSEFKFTKDAGCAVCGETSTIKDLTIHQNAAPPGAAACEVPTMTSQAADEISVAELARWRGQKKPHVLLDVRGPAELAICRIDGSVNVPLPELEQRLAELDRDAEIVVQCKSGARSQRAAALLTERGFAKVHNLTGGILAWIDQVDPSLPKY
jgi:adenylyltransferase/sulfurtransferase